MHNQNLLENLPNTTQGFKCSQKIKCHTGREASSLTPSHMPQPWVWQMYCSHADCLPSTVGMRHLEITLAGSTLSISVLSCAPNPLLCTCAKLLPASFASNHTERAPPPLLPLSTHFRKHHFCCSPPALLKSREDCSRLPVLASELFPVNNWYEISCLRAVLLHQTSSHVCVSSLI